MTLIIAEKPSLAQNIAAAIGGMKKQSGFYTGDKYIVTWAFGHLFSLVDVENYTGEKPGSKWSMDKLPCFPEKFRFELKKSNGKTDPGVERQFGNLRSLCNRSDVDTIVNAGDADREGEIIVRLCIENALKSKKRLLSAEADIQSRQLEVSLYSIRQRVENIFLGILLIDKQIAQNEIVIKSLHRNRESVQAGIEHGISYKSDLNVVDVNILNYKQTISALESDRKAYVTMLGRLTGEDLSQVKFAEPSMDLPIDTAALSRPELQLYKAQLQQIQVQRQDLQTNLYPKLNLSLQGGIGRPGLNMLKNEFEPYYTVGVKLQWNLGALYSRKNDIRKIAIQKEQIEREQETFLFNTMLDVTDQLNEIHKAENVLEQDREIIRLREDIRQAGEEQYKQGVIMMTDLMDMIDEEFNAKVTESLHQVQLIMAICNLKNTLGQN